MRDSSARYAVAHGDGSTLLAAFRVNAKDVSPRKVWNPAFTSSWHFREASKIVNGMHRFKKFEAKLWPIWPTLKVKPLPPPACAVEGVSDACGLKIFSGLEIPVHKNNLPTDRRRKRRRCLQSLPKRCPISICEAEH